MKRWINFVSGLFGVLALIILAIGVIALFRGVAGISGSSAPAIGTQDTPASRRTVAPSRTPVPTVGLIIPTYTPMPTYAPPPQPTPGPTADLTQPWLVYTDTQWGFSIRYPSDPGGVSLEERETIRDGIARKSLSIGVWLKPTAFLTIWIEDNPMGLAVEQVFETRFKKYGVSQNVPEVLFSVEEHLKQAGAQAVKVFQYEEDGAFEVLAQRGSRIYGFTFVLDHARVLAKPQAVAFFERIMKTFRFLN